MRAFFRRLGICGWLLWAAISLMTLCIALYQGAINHSDIYSHRSYETRPEVPARLMASYRANTLPVEEREVLLRGIANYELNVPAGEEIVIPRSFAKRWEFASEVLIGAGIVAILIAMLQYLLIGHPNPVRLVKERL